MKKQKIKKEIDFFNSLEAEEYCTIPGVTFTYILSVLNGLNLQGHILEAGCGTAAFGRRLLELSDTITITGVDINKKFIKQINKSKLSRYRAICGNLEDSKLFADRQFNFILFPYVLHHIPNLEVVINNAHRWLKDGGIMIIIDPNGSNIVLKLSFRIRQLLYKLFPRKISQYASLNERHIPIKDFLSVCQPVFKNITITDFLMARQSEIKLNFIGILDNLRYFLLRINYLIGIIKYPGTDLIITGEKDRKK